MIKIINFFIFTTTLFQTTILSQETINSLYYSLGSYSMQENKYEEALENFKLSIKLNEPKIKESTIEAGVCDNILGNYKEAIKYGEKALLYKLSDSEKGIVYWLLGKSYGFLENYKTAFTYFDLMEKVSNLYKIPIEFKFVKEGWIYITQSNYDNIYYNKNTIKKSEKGKIKIWLKWYWDGKTFNDEDLKKISEYGGDTTAVNRRINEIMTERENVSNTLYYEEYDFNNNRTSLLEILQSDNTGEIINNKSWFGNGTAQHSANNWSNVVPGSTGDFIFNILKNKFNN